jgi:riboflavin kinase/FMN adenylyltransferase
MTEFITGWPDHTPKNAWLTIGNFDGVHLGHQALIHGLQERAEAQQGQSLVLTFWPHPRVVLGQVSEAFLLTTQQEKQRQLQNAGVDLVLTLLFDQHLADLNAEDFLERLVASLNPAGLLVGPAFRLGKDRQGDFAFIQSFCGSRGIACETFPPFQLEGQVVSSNRIRANLVEGQIAEAARLLGRPFSLEGVIQPGKQIGSKLGFPTANLDPDPLQLLPRFGVYATRLFIEGQVLMGVTNVGVRPTFESGATPNVETLILDFDDRIYHETMRIEFLNFLRPERHFEQVESLIAQIEDDEAQTRRIFQNEP